MRLQQPNYRVGRAEILQLMDSGQESWWTASWSLGLALLGVNHDKVTPIRSHFFVTGGLGQITSQFPPSVTCWSSLLPPR
jgi:hypothetical protein